MDSNMLFEKTVQQSTKLYKPELDLSDPQIKKAVERTEKFQETLNKIFASAFALKLIKNEEQERGWPDSPENIVISTSQELLREAIHIIAFYKALAVEFCREIKLLEEIIADYEFGIIKPGESHPKAPHLKIVK